MFKFSKNKNTKLYPNYTKEELETVLPMTHIVAVNSVGIINVKGKDVAYSHKDFALLDKISEPTSIIVLTNKSGENYPEPVKLLKTNAATVSPTYVFKSEGKEYDFRDNIPLRKNNKVSLSIKELLDKIKSENELIQEEAIEKFNKNEKIRASQEFIDNMFSK